MTCAKKETSCARTLAVSVSASLAVGDAVVAFAGHDPAIGTKRADKATELSARNQSKPVSNHLQDIGQAYALPDRLAIPPRLKQ